MEDITKTGPVGLQGMKGLNQSPSASSQYFQNLQRMSVSQLSRAYLPKAEENVGVQLGQAGYGDSTYDEAATRLTQVEDLNELRAQEQPWYAKAGAGILKGTGLVATTFISGTAGLADGIVESIVDGDMSRMWDNRITQSMDALNRSMEQELPNYYSQDELQNPLALRNIRSANTIFDKFGKNLGFMVGAAYSGGIYSKIVGAAAKGLGYLSGASKVFKLGDTALSTMNEMSTVQKLNTLGLLGMKTIEQSFKAEASKALAGSIMNAYAEGTVEAVSNSNDAVRVQAAELDNQVYQDKAAALEEVQEKLYNGEITPEEAEALLTQKYTNIDNAAALSKKKMEENRTKIGDGILIANLPILTLDNLFMFGKMYAGGWKPARNQANTVTRIKREAMREAKEAAKRGDKTLLEKLERIENTSFGKLSDADKAFLEEIPRQGLLDNKIVAAAKSPLREGNEEMMQAWAAETYMDLYKRDADYVYDSKVNPEAAEQFGDYWSEFWKSHSRGLKNSYGNPLRWEEFIIGALTGAMGVPTFGRANNSTDQTWLGKGKVIGLTGGIASDLNDFRASRKDRMEVAQHVNRIMHDPNLKNRLEHVRAQIAFNNDKQAAVELKDKKMYKDAETAALFEDIMYLKRADRLHLLEEVIGSMENISDEEAQAIIDDTTAYISATKPDVDKHRQEIERLDQAAANIRERMEELGGQMNEAFLDGDDTSAYVLSERVSSLNQQLDEIKEARDSHQQSLDSASKRRLSPYVKSDGTVFTPNEVRQVFAEKTQKMKDFIKMVSDVQDEIDLNTSEILSDNQLATLTYYQVAMKDWTKRGADIVKDLKDTLVNSNMIGILRKHIQRHREKLELETQVSEGLNHKDAKARVEQTLRNLDVLESNLDQFLANNPEAIISMLANVESINTTDKEGNVSTTNLKDIFLQTLNSAIETDAILSDNEKAEAKTNVEDLGRMIDSLKERNQIFKDALANPGNIEKRQAAIDSKHISRKQRELVNKFKEEIDFEDALSVRAAYNKYKSGINEMGLDRFLSNFTKAEQDAIRGAIGNGTSKQIISGIIDDDIEEDASVKSAAKQVLDGIQDLSAEGLHKISTDSSVDEAIVEAAAGLVESINDDEAVRAAKQAEFEDRIKNLLVKAASEASDVIKEKEKDLEKSRGTYGSDRTTSSANRDPKSGNESTPNPNPGYATNDTNSGPSPKAGTEANPANGATPEEVPMDREDEYDANNNKGESKVKETRQKAVGLGRQDTKKDNNLAFRRQLTEFYIFGEYGQKLADWYEQDKGRVPDPLDADSFIAYLRAVTDFLSRNGAFTYVSGINKDNRLTSGQEVWFDVEDSLTDANGVKVVVIKTLDSQDNEQVIGTIRTQYEFEAYDAAVEDGKQEKSKAIEAQRKLYEEVIRRHENGITDKVTTKVDKLAKGSLPLVQINSTVAEVFEVGDSTEDSSVPIIGVAAPRTANSPTIMIHNGNRADNIAEVDAAVLLPGQVYVLIPSNTGQYVPALCVSTPMAELSKDDWYIQQAVNALWDVLENGISRKNEFIKWLPVKNLHINLRKKKEQGKWEDAILGQADAVFIKFTGKDGKEVNITVSLKDASGNPLSREAITADLNKFIMDTGKYQGLYTNVDKRKLSDLNYTRNMSRYLRVNLPRGLGGQHTMNDGFLYIPTSIEKQHTDGTTVPMTPVETHTTPQGTSKSVIYKGKRYTVDMAGQVFDSKNVPIRGKLAEEIKKSINGATEAPTAGVKKPSAKRPTKDPFNTRGGRRKPSAPAKAETENLKAVFERIMTQTGSSIIPYRVLLAVGFLDKQFSYESYVSAIQLIAKIDQKKTYLLQDILTKEQYEELSGALSKTSADEVEVLDSRNAFRAYEGAFTNYEESNVQDLSEYLKARNISMEDYKKLSLEDKISILHCI